MVQDVTGQGAEPAQVPPPAAKGGPLSRARALAGQHKLATAIAVLLVAAAVVGVATGSLSGGTSSTPSASSSTGNSIEYSSPAAAPAFSLPALSAASTTGAAGTTGASSTVSLAKYQGKPLIVNFFASWCAPCQQETPLIASFYKANAGHVIVLGVDGNDSSTQALAFVRAKGVTYPIGVDQELITASAYNVAGFPQTFFLDSRHRIVYRVLGAVTQAQLRQGVALMDAR
jgi:cytochrome c biogenesis protein CcmG/thiol:disulfide interchange protein DsbE